MEYISIIYINIEILITYFIVNLQFTEVNKDGWGFETLLFLRGRTS